MITGFVLDVLFAVTYAISSILLNLPDASLPVGVTNAFMEFGYWCNSLEVFFPAYEVLAILGIVTTLMFAIFMVRFIRFGLSLIPFF